MGIGNVLCPHREEFWLMERRQPGDPHYRWEEPDQDSDDDYDQLVTHGYVPQLRKRFRHDLLGQSRIPMPLYYVSQEARAVAIDWLRANGFNHRFWPPSRWQPRGTPLMFVRPFNLCCDAIYIPTHGFEVFTHPRSTPEIQGSHTLESDARRFAVSEKLLSQRRNDIADSLLLNHGCADTLLVVVESDIECPDDPSLTEWHEFETLSDGAFFWDDGREVFEFIGEQQPAYKNKYRSIEDIIQTFSQVVGWARQRDRFEFEVRLVKGTQSIDGLIPETLVLDTDPYMKT
ncbi:hypothetical protein ANO11243_066810 [Dothideomycetidae sp. 11243]|nr:hypothetical protein ANO11243_066810 [fungal sp. No.11243]